MERASLTRLRWRLRGAWMWPAFVVATVADAVLLHALPVATNGIGVVPALLLCGFLNLFVVAVVAPLSGRLVRRRRPDLPKAVAADYAGAALLAAVAGLLLVGGLVHRPAVERAERDLRLQGAAARAFLLTNAPPAVRSRMDAANTIRLADGFYRTCVPEGRPRRAFCVFVRTTQDPPLVRADPDRSPNTEYRTVVP
jgi:MFS family permease